MLDSKYLMIWDISDLFQAQFSSCFSKVFEVDNAKLDFVSTSTVIGER